jgi:Xaa-Pro aminopeptidase
MATVQTNPATKKFPLKKVQEQIAKQSLDGWLFFYFHENDPLALRILDVGQGHFTRRWFYYVPAQGTPVKLVHRIESSALDSLPGDLAVYLGWRQLEEKLATILQGVKSVAMQYSPRGAVPYVSKVDAGTVELIRSFGVEVVSSGNLIQHFESVWTEDQLQSHIAAAEILRATVFSAFKEIRDQIKAGRTINEYEVQQFIMREFEGHGLETNSPPIVAVNAHAGSPHYQPNKDSHVPIKAGDFVLLDIWAKKKAPVDAVYADITWTGYVGETVPERYEEIFQIVRGARDAAVEHVKQAVARKEWLPGWQVDDITRKYITDRGYGDQFVHRTGHSIGVEVHGNGANIDNLETKDERCLLPNTAFSIEPGIYLEDFGVRSEIDVFVSESGVQVHGLPMQTEVIPIMAL